MEALPITVGPCMLCFAERVGRLLWRPKHGLRQPDGWLRQSTGGQLGIDKQWIWWFLELWLGWKSEHRRFFRRGRLG